MYAKSANVDEQLIRISSATTCEFFLGQHGTVMSVACVLENEPYIRLTEKKMNSKFSSIFCFCNYILLSKCL